MNIDKGLIRHWAMLFESENLRENVYEDINDDSDQRLGSDIKVYDDSVGQAVRIMKNMNDDEIKFFIDFILTQMRGFWKELEVEANLLKDSLDSGEPWYSRVGISREEELKKEKSALEVYKRIIYAGKNLSPDYSDDEMRKIKGRWKSKEDNEVYESGDMPANSIKQTDMWFNAFKDKYCIMWGEKDLLLLGQYGDKYDFVNLTRIRDIGNMDAQKLEESISRIMLFDSQEEAKRFINKFPILDDEIKTVKIPMVGGPKEDIGLMYLSFPRVGELEQN